VSEHEAAAQQRVSLDCEAEGNPQPTYSWTKVSTFSPARWKITWAVIQKIPLFVS